ncbi:MULTISPECIES: hypothetical protein [Streptomyces]|uniref:Uncharacterized protein n=1 Tax=Streptomyces fradiae ATCC 10745 = DSM 40063 TaxID=1319510 RepID=A0A1Y2NTU5_STRFR|nr:MULTISPECIES: hypothetical protein [Streptomyces]KAF0647117.1 hypothetical protein K701_25340 [Streptomyces fradiae ATCC 10745 = DSM 40063]OSY50457.1 hypothetical protein BG846_03935 [Streptomyces fradiae ATCC 10745 = DSM 40063]QEV12063.1 hypothetical protein CP974_08550 [Streptomyces fradiae ATCC 10745 = DSM 40063]
MLVRVIRMPRLPAGTSAILDVQSSPPVLWLQEDEFPANATQAVKSKLEALLNDDDDASEQR